MTCAIRWTSAVVLAVFAAACGTGEDNVPTGTMHLSGNVRSQPSSGGAPFPIADAEVRATVDRNRDGAISADETSLATTDSDGAYKLDVPINPGDRVVVRFGMDGYGAVSRRLEPARSGSMTLDATLSVLEPIDCTGTSCSVQQGSLVVKGLPQGTTGAARLFNPATETDAFPGDFDESTGKLLVSGAFAAFDLRSGGQPLHDLPAPIELRMRLPRDTWVVVQDVSPGNDRIDTPLYFFDEVKGTWVRDANLAHLEDGDGNVIAASALASIRNGSFAGVVYAVGKVGRVATWNVDWPIESHGCVSGRILDESGNPVDGATVRLTGVSYTGTGTTMTGGDGRFCLDAPRSEAPGEDLDGNGRAGEKVTVSISAVAAGKLHDLGEFEMPTSGGTCGGSGCLDLGNLRLTAANVRTARVCSVSGTVKYLDGSPAAGATVLFLDATVPGDVLDATCASAPDGSCKVVDFTGADGSFDVATAVIGAPQLSVLGGRELEPGASALLVGSRLFASCPKTPIVITLNSGFIEVNFDVAVDGNTISWTPARYGASLVTVRSDAGIKWQVRTEITKVMRAPINYGVVPAGATQFVPAQGAPAPLAPGDLVSVEVIGASIDGLPYIGSGSATR